MKRDPFPLQWPDGWARTRQGGREKSRFGFRSTGQVSFSSARNDLLVELDRLGAANIVITSDLPTRHDGLPYANGRADELAVRHREPDSDTRLGRVEERVFACDKWRSHAENMQAIAKSIEAMRGLERWGAGDVVSRAFAGFAALPPPSGDAVIPPEPARPKRTWRDVLGSAITGAPMMPWPDLENSEVLAIAKARHRKLIQLAHPDAGGSHELAAEINAALAEAERDLGATP